MKCTLIKRLDNLCIAIGGGVLDNGSTVLAGSLVVGAIASEFYFWDTQDRPVEKKVLVIPPLKQELKLDEDPNLIKADIHRQAESIFKYHGLPLGLATVMLRYESNTGDLMVSKTGCLGFYQFCKKTAKHYNLTEPMDLVKSSHAAAKLMKDNMKYLKGRNVKADPVNLYLAHMIGGYGIYLLNKAKGGEVLSKNQTRTLKKVMKPNWYKQMGKFKGTNQDMATRFKDHVEVEFSKREPTYS